MGLQQNTRNCHVILWWALHIPWQLSSWMLMQTLTKNSACLPSHCSCIENAVIKLNVSKSMDGVLQCSFEATVELVAKHNSMFLFPQILMACLFAGKDLQTKQNVLISTFIGLTNLWKNWEPAFAKLVHMVRARRDLETSLAARRQSNLDNPVEWFA